MGIGLLPHSRDFFSIANTEVLLVGMALLMGAVGTSMFLKKMEWAKFPWADRAPIEIPFVGEMLRLPAQVPFPDDSEEYESLPERRG